MTEYITFFKSRFKIKNINYIYIIIACFGIIYTLISLVNHYNFRTYAFTLKFLERNLFTKKGPNGLLSALLAKKVSCK